MSATSIIASLPYYIAPIVQQLNTYEGISVKDFITNCTRGGLAGVVGIFPNEAMPSKILNIHLIIGRQQNPWLLWGTLLRKRVWLWETKQKSFIVIMGLGKQSLTTVQSVCIHLSCTKVYNIKVNT